MNKSIKVRVKIGSQKEKVVKEGDTYYVYTNSLARENKANLSVIELLSDYLDIPKSYITIKTGVKSKTKIIEINDN